MNSNSYNPSVFFRTGTYCLDITARSPLSSTASNRPLMEGEDTGFIYMKLVN